MRYAYVLSSLSTLLALAPAARAQFDRPLSSVLHIAATPASASNEEASHVQRYDVDTRDLREWRRIFRSRDWQRRVLAVRGLARFGDTDALVRALRDRQPHVRRAACEVLGPYHGVQRERATPQLAALVRDPDRGVREAATLALGWMRIRSRRAVDAVLEASHDAFARIRTQAAISLGELRGSERDAASVARLVALLRESNVFVREAATRSLAWILRDSPEFAAHVTPLLRVTDWRVRLAACQAFDGSVAWWRGHGETRASVRTRRRVLAALRESARHDKFWRVRDAAALALAGL